MGELWLAPRLRVFREAHPNVRFCINASGDVPLELGAPDLRVTYGGGRDERLFTDVLLPLSGLDNLRRIIGKESEIQMEGMALLHLKDQLELKGHPGWADWFRKFGHRKIGMDRGVRYQHARLALEAVGREVGFLLCDLSLAQRDIDEGRTFNLFPMSQYLTASQPYRLKLRKDIERRPLVQKFVAWLRDQAYETQRHIDKMTAQGQE